jgi:glycine cleavage system H protein
VYSPISGEVLEVNAVLADKPATVNSDPYKGGWIMKVKISNKAELSNLLDAAAYTKETAH